MAHEYPLHPVGVRHHIEPQNTQGMRYLFNGEWHFILQDEIDQIERSGRSVDQYGSPMTVQAYASTDCPNEWPSVTVPVVPLMKARPGAVEPMLRPVQEFIAVSRKDRPARMKAKDGFIHMYRVGSHVTACGSQASAVDTWGFLRFGRIIDHQRSCRKCGIEWLGHWAKRKRNEDKARYRRHTRDSATKAHATDYVKPIRWTADEKRRLKEYRAVASGVSTHGKRVPERGSATDHRTGR